MGLKNIFLRKRLDPRIEELKSKIEKTIMTAQMEQRFSFFEFNDVAETLKRCEQLNDAEKYNFFYDLSSNWDKHCHLSRKAGELINRLSKKDSNVTLAIHRTYLGPIKEKNGIPSTEILNSIMQNGLINNGHAMQGATTQTPLLSLTTSPLYSMGDMINLLASYKGSNGTILLAFPKDKVDKDLDFINNSEKVIYRKENNINYIRPEYILGAILKQDGGLDKYYTKEQLSLSQGKKKE